MYQGKHHKRSRRRSGKSSALLVSLLLIVCVSVGGTIAFLMDTDGPLHNMFTPSQVTTYVEETIENGIKSNVRIQNTGDTTAYIRAAVVVTWQDEAGNVYGQVPVACTDQTCPHDKCGNDYAIVYNPGHSEIEKNWVQAADGFWYYTSPVKSEVEDAENCTTDVLITSCKQLKPLTVGETTYYLAVEIISSGIQSVPDYVVEDEWSNDEVVIKVNTDDTGNKVLSVTPANAGSGN